MLSDQFFKRVVKTNSLGRTTEYMSCVECEKENKEQLYCLSTSKSSRDYYLTTAHKLEIQKKARRNLMVPEADLMDKDLVRFIVSGQLAFRSVENEDFQLMFEHSNCGYTLPCRAKLSDLIDETYELARAKVMETLQRCSHLAMTTDTWTSKQNFNYMSFTAHYLDFNFVMQAVCLGNL